MAGLIYVIVFVTVAVLVVASLAKLVRAIAELAAGSGGEHSRVIWMSGALAAVSLIPSALLGFALVAAGAFDDQLARTLSLAAVVAAFPGVASGVASAILVSRPASRRSLPSEKLRRIIYVDAIGLASALAVLWMFRGMYWGR